MQKLSLNEARKVVLLSQQVLPAIPKGSALEATRQAINHLGYIQIDTISAIARAHNHTFWNRNPLYEPKHLDQLMIKKEVFEYWSHAAAYLPVKDYRFTLPRKRAIASGTEPSWYKSDVKLMSSILERIRIEGPLMAKDFGQAGKILGKWESKPTRQALELLFLQGELMIPRRINFHKVFDLPERVLPSDTETAVPSETEYARFLITRFLRSNGIGQPAEISYLLKNTKAIVSDTLNTMLAEGELIKITIRDKVYYAFPSSLDLLNKPLRRNRLKILSPFDNLLIQRKRTKALFDFDYLLECYLPATKRKYGYFVLPILWDGKFVARMDCKADRSKDELIIRNLVLEGHLRKQEAFASAFSKELKRFMAFNGCTSIRLEKIEPINFRSTLERAFVITEIEVRQAQ